MQEKIGTITIVGQKINPENTIKCLLFRALG